MQDTSCRGLTGIDKIRKGGLQTFLGSSLLQHKMGYIIEDLAI